MSVQRYSEGARPVDSIRSISVLPRLAAQLSTQHELPTRVGRLRPDPQLSDLINDVARVLQALIKSLERLPSPPYRAPVPPVSLSRSITVSLDP